MLVKKQSIASRRNKNASDIDCLDICDADDEGFIEGDIATGKVLSAFNFGMSTAANENKASVLDMNAQENTGEVMSTQGQTYTSVPKGLTPPINGEYYTIKRSYAMRPSTVRKLNALKAEHPDVNVLFNTIVDMAISHYYKHIFSDGGTFDIQEEKDKTS